MSRAAAAVALGGALLLSAAMFGSPSLYVPGGGLCRVGGPPGGDVLVLPRIEPVLAAGAGGSGAGRVALGGAGHGLTVTGLQASAAELEVDGLRPYREGTSASRIHWPAVARTR